VKTYSLCSHRSLHTLGILITELLELRRRFLEKSGRIAGKVSISDRETKDSAVRFPSAFGILETSAWLACFHNCCNTA
jgi:hypothetical protein